ncbi:group III truncated hemoglobin [Adhaeribacter aquaticus]|uniref:group III truncated hemoglobin n=1 Tax=Adhaeribacter aquaticus TaxID=299567 RepID=UPI00041834F3|nr:group III truncated hemoglobin [Adhaeribacter aquaticus]
MNKSDITNTNDIQILVETFYNKIQSQPYLLALYEKLSPRDWTLHLFQMKNFWDSILLKSGRYKGHPQILHAFLPAQQDQVREWVHLFHEAIEEHFTGPTAAAAQQLADKLVQVFTYKTAFK